jgi:hypothetical protein
MNIRAEVSSYYKWDVLPAGEAPPPGVVSAPVEFQGETRTAVRRLVGEPNFVDISVPDEQLDQMHADHQAAGGQMTRNQFLARHLEDAVLAQHAPSAHWQAFSSDDPDVHAHLQNWGSQFGGGEVAVAPPPLAVVPDQPVEQVAVPAEENPQ